MRYVFPCRNVLARLTISFHFLALGSKSLPIPELEQLYLVLIAMFAESKRDKRLGFTVADCGRLQKAWPEVVTSLRASASRSSRTSLRWFTRSQTTASSSSCVATLESDVGELFMVATIVCRLSNSCWNTCRPTNTHSPTDRPTC